MRAGRGELVVDYFALISDLMRGIAAPVVGAALILAGIFLRLLGKGISYLILGGGIVATAYVTIFPPHPLDLSLVYAVFAVGIGASVALALALRALTAAIEFGFFTVGWYLLLPAVPGYTALLGITGAVPLTWMGSSILTTALAELLMRRLRITRRLPVPAVAAIASTARGARR